MFIRFLFIPILLIISLPAFACQCPKGTYKFVKKLKHAQYVGYVEVIGFDTIKDHDFDATFTILKVIHRFKGNINDLTIKVLDGGDVDCTHSLHYPIGSKFIIRAMVKSRKEYEFNFDETPLSNSEFAVDDPVLVLGICSETIIQVKNNKAIGFITEDRMKSKNPQSIEISEAIRLIEKRLKHDKKLPLTSAIGNGG